MQTATQREEENAQNMYLAPAFKFSTQECDAVLTEVDEMRQVLNGERVSELSHPAPNISCMSRNRKSYLAISLALSGTWCSFKQHWHKPA